MDKHKPFTEKREQQMKSVLKTMNRIQKWLFTKTNGRMGNTFLFRPVGMLTCKGRKSGEERKAMLVYLKDGNNIVLVASQAGVSNHPAWYLNLTANPECYFQAKTNKMAMTAKTANPEEYAELWPKLVKLYSGYETYKHQAKANSGRDVPVVILEPRAE